MAALHGPPCVALRRAELCLLPRVPTDGGRVEHDRRAVQRRQPCRLGEPLVPADQHADPSVPRRPRAEAEVARREVKLLVVAGIIRNVHLPVQPRHASVGINHDRRVVIDARRATLKDRYNDNHLFLLRDFAQRSRGQPRHRFGQVKQSRILPLTKIL